MVLDRGKVAERGTHRQLITAGGQYQRMWAAWRDRMPVAGAGTRLAG